MGWIGRWLLSAAPLCGGLNSGSCDTHNHWPRGILAACRRHGCRRGHASVHPSQQDLAAVTRKHRGTCGPDATTPGGRAACRALRARSRGSCCSAHAVCPTLRSPGVGWDTRTQSPGPVPSGDPTFPARPARSALRLRYAYRGRGLPDGCRLARGYGRHTRVRARNLMGSRAAPYSSSRPPPMNCVRFAVQ